MEDNILQADDIEIADMADILAEFDRQQQEQARDDFDDSEIAPSDFPALLDLCVWKWINSTSHIIALKNMIKLYMAEHNELNIAAFILAVKLNVEKLQGYALRRQDATWEIEASNRFVQYIEHLFYPFLNGNVDHGLAKFLHYDADLFSTILPYVYEEVNLISIFSILQEYIVEYASESENEDEVKCKLKRILALIPDDEDEDVLNDILTDLWNRVFPPNCYFDRHIQRFMVYIDCMIQTIIDQNRRQIRRRRRSRSLSSSRSPKRRR